MLGYVRRLLELPGDVARVRRRDGLRRALAVAHERVLRDLYHRSRLLALEHDLAALAPVSIPDGVTIQRLPASHLAALEEIAMRPTLRRFRRRFEAGDTCFVARRDGCVIGYGWIIERLDPALEGYPLPLPGTAVYMTDLYVAGTERVRGVGTAITSVRLHHARELGYRTVWRLVAADNLPSLRAWQKAAPVVTQVGETSSLRLLGRGWSGFHPARRAPAALGHVAETTR